MLCEFCEELSNRSSRIEEIYGVGFRRTVRSYGPVVAFPTIGQLFFGSMLIVPTEHVETIAGSADCVQESVEEAIRDVEASLRNLGQVLLFEHGARRCTGSGCGVYHAHIHAVPIPTHLSCNEFLPNVTTVGRSSLREAWNALQRADNYFLCRDTHGLVAFADSSNDPVAPWSQSQFGRRQLVRLFGLNADWDWKKYSVPETSLLSTLKLFETPHDSLREGN